MKRTIGTAYSPHAGIGSQLLFLLVLSISLSATYAVWHNARQQAEQDLKNDFEFRVRETVARIEQRMATYEQILRGVRGLFAASGNIKRDEFRNYVGMLQLEQNYPGIQGLGYSLIVPKADRDEHIRDMHRQGFADYAIHPEGEREIYTPTVQLEPFSGRNLRAFGYDMYAEPVRREAMIQACDQGKTSVSGKVKLVQETDEQAQAGFLMYMPVYRNGLPHDTLAERRANIVGWVYEPFRMDDLMAGIGGERAAELDLEIYDGETVSEQAKMYDSHVMPGNTHTQPPYFKTVRHIKIAGHPWTLAIHSQPTFETRMSKGKPKLIAIVGIALSLLLSLLAWLLATGRTRALAIAEDMTRELKESEMRFRLMADSAPVLIWMAGKDKRCFWFNKGWLDFTGRTLAQEVGDGWVQEVHADDLQRCVDFYVSHFDRREPFRMEYRIKRHDGEYRWILDVGIPRFDDSHNFIGYIGSGLDITEHRLTEEALRRANAELTRFAEISAHHLMEPVRRFTIYTQRLRQLLTELHEDQELSISLDTLERDADHLRGLVRDIQLYLAAGEPHGILRLEDANAVLTAVKQRLSSRWTELEAIIMAENLPQAMLDRPRLMDLFTEILDNALRYGRPVDAGSRPQVYISGERDGALSRYRISDNGAGIPAEYLRRVFEIFERLKPGSTEGSGIGLSIARRIVESRNGSIWIENAPQGGAMVVFELPDGKIKNDA
ncbi:CHASE domain-containing sensor histidine kinase [Methylobacter sp. YRD-M1]|uniref:CHASE domain-containing sensor histidine kinase n=1 Tax=Methylobacter sp. YRD-M1 TaxID=2911520 RepID=UPI00227C01F1|nr:CHASE domain-containing protein [Methylobacter sp. YRD-M1]WAK03495.1 CHASE domain-containing protein [Methylobacter sp. YRD-M1]